jgi:predicted hotdog family 3-hydroxylacyl-ACP dehydratase
MTVLDRDRIMSMIPHAGAMCLLDSVLQWDETSLRCLSRRYRQHDNPLRRADGVLGAACCVEIATQAMSLHGRLAAGDDRPPVQGYIASLRDARLHARTLDPQGGDLIIAVTRLIGGTDNAAYRFVVSVQNTELLSGRAMVVLRPSP